MATRLKTIEYWFPMLTTAVDAADTNFTQITIYIPDLPSTTGSSFKSVLFEVIFHDRNTTLGNVSRRQLSISLGGASYTAINNANAIANGGEQQTILCSGDFTSHFNTNWTDSATSETCDARILLDSAVSSPLNPAFSNISGRLIITYEYDDTKTTQIKTVRIPLNANVGTAATSKGSATDTIPALDTELTETSKTYRQRVITVQGNDNGASTDLTWNWQVESYTKYTSQAYEHGSNVAMFVRMNSIETEFDTSISRGWYLWANSGGNHMQAWLTVTYEFDSTASTACFVSLLLPMEINSPMGGPTSSDYQRANREIFIVEPTTITTKQIAFYAFWDQLTAISALYMRVGTGSFVTYTDAAAVVAGSNACMVRNDSAFSLARGRNTISFDIYRTDTADVGYNVSGFWILNYTCGKPTDGYGAANHTILWALCDTGTAAAAVQKIVSATAPAIPEADFFLAAIGVEGRIVPSSATAMSGASIGVERLSGEGGIEWELIYSDLGGTDGETGVFHEYAQARDVFRRWPGDADSDRLDIETSRRWRIAGAQSVANLAQLILIFTYHTITWSIAGSVTGSNSGTVTLNLYQTVIKEVVKSTTRAGDGSFSFTWYNDTENVQVIAYEDATHSGASKQGIAGS